MRSLPYSWFYCPREDWQSDESSGRALEVNKRTSKMLLHTEYVRVITVWDIVRTPYTSQVLLLYVKPHKVGLGIFLNHGLFILDNQLEKIRATTHPLWGLFMM